jgi:Rieske Fe-S protein
MVDLIKNTQLSNRTALPVIQPRRDFIKTIFVVMATSTLGSSKWNRFFAAEAQDVDIPFPAGQFTFHLSDYPALLTDLGSVSLEIPNLPNILVTRLSPGEFAAVTSVCTHEGCSVQPYSSDFGGMHCPCHHSLFAPDGSVLGGPAPKPLYRYELEYDGADRITITLVRFSYAISAEVASFKVRGQKRLGITFDSEQLNNYAIMFKTSLTDSDWTQVQFAEALKDDLTNDLFMGTGDRVTLYVEMPNRTGIFTVARYHLLGA